MLNVRLEPGRVSNYLKTVSRTSSILDWKISHDFIYPGRRVLRATFGLQDQQYQAFSYTRRRLAEVSFFRSGIFHARSEAHPTDYPKTVDFRSAKPQWVTVNLQRDSIFSVQLGLELYLRFRILAGALAPSAIAILPAVTVEAKVGDKNHVNIFVRNP